MYNLINPHTFSIMNNNNQSYDEETTYIPSMEELEAYQEKQFED